MLERTRCPLRFAAAVVAGRLLGLLPTAPPSAAEPPPQYEFEHAWPHLKPAWNFNRPADIAVDNSGHVVTAHPPPHRVDQMGQSE